MDCIFCQIAAGKAEASKIFENERVVAFLDIQPVRPGQTLIIPKEHIDHFSDIPDDLAMEIYAVTHKLSRIIRDALKPERVGLVVHGYGVAHAHMVIVPQHDEADIVSGRMAGVENGSVVFSVKNLPPASRSELDDIARLIREAV